MLFWKTIDVADNEVVFVFRRERLDGLLGAGRHKVQLGGAVRFEVYDITEVVFQRARGKFLFNTYRSMLSPYIEMHELSDEQVGLLYRDGRLADILAPGSVTMLWRGVEELRVEVLDIGERYEIEPKLLSLLGRGANLSVARLGQSVQYVEVLDEHVGLLTVNGKLVKVLESGCYGYWKYNRSVVVKQMDLRLQTVDVSGQEILTKDRVSLRVNLLGSYKLFAPLKVALKLGDYSGFIYRELQLSLREAIGRETLDGLLEAKESLNDIIASNVKERLCEYGIELVSVGVKDIILPGDMKVILNQVVEAQKEAEANLIKRREETQAVRSLHNTAKMMDNNPTLMRLKELEALERVTSRIDKLTVFGGLDGVMKDMIKISP